MATSSWTRRRAGLVVAASAAAVLTVTSMAGAHEGTDDENVLHGCVSNGSGALRVVSATSLQCRPNETPVHWPLESGADELAEFVQRLLDGDNPDDLVHWNNIAGVPGLLADGQITYQEISGVIALAPGSVDGATVQDGSLTSSDLQDGTLTGVDIADGTLGGSDIASGSLTGDHIADGTLAGADLADGAVTPGKMTPVVQSGFTGANPLPLVNPQMLAPTPVQVSADSLVMVIGQVQLRRDCSPCVPNVQHVVRYQVVRDGAPIGPQYRLELSAEHRFDVASVSLLDSGFTSAGPATYEIRVQAESGAAGVDIVATDAVLTAQVLGGQ